MLAVTYFLLIFIFIVGNCEENNNFHEPKNTNQNLAKSFQVLKEYHEQAQSLEKQVGIVYFLNLSFPSNNNINIDLYS